MIINDVVPEYGTLNALEKIYLSHKSEPEGGLDEYGLLAIGLCGVYFRSGMTTFHSDTIRDAAIGLSERLSERQGILFPLFREFRDRYEKRPFIEMNQPFLYKSLPGKDVRLYCRVDGEPIYTAYTMKYVRFGLYLAAVPVFYGEKVDYYFSEEMPAGSITTQEKRHENDALYLCEDSNAGDQMFFTVNNAIIYERMFKYDKVEAIINGLVKDVKNVRSSLM
jgi:hypothetical protein